MAHINLHIWKWGKGKIQKYFNPLRILRNGHFRLGQMLLLQGCGDHVCVFHPHTLEPSSSSIFCNISFAGIVSRQKWGMFRVFWIFFFFFFFFGYLVNSFRYVSSGCVVESLYKELHNATWKGWHGITKWVAKTPLLCIPFLPLYPHLDIEYSGCRSENWGVELSYPFLPSAITYYTPRALLSAWFSTPHIMKNLRNRENVRKKER